MKTIYVAGPLGPRGNVYPGSLAIEYLTNVRYMTTVATLLMGQGWAPFCPGIDLIYFLVGPHIPDEKEIKSVSIEWLRRSDAMVLIGAWRKSRGCRAELRVAKKLGIKVFYGCAEVPCA